MKSLRAISRSQNPQNGKSMFGGVKETKNISFATVLLIAMNVQSAVYNLDWTNKSPSSVRIDNVL